METLRNTLRPLPASDYVLFQLFMRDAEDRMTLSTFTDYGAAMAARLAPDVVSWQLRRWDGRERRMVIQAVSTNWFTIQPNKVMNPRPAADVEVVDDCRVERDGDTIRIYFTPAAPRLFDSHVKVYKQRYLVIEGNVTPHNYNGFLRAVALAPRYMEQV